MFVLLLTVFIDLVGFGIILPILPFYAQAFDATPLQITLLVAAYSAVQIASSPIWGRLSDRYGRKIILLLTLTGGAMAYLWFGLAESLAGLFAARALSGAMAGNIAVAQAYMVDISDTDGLAGAMGRLGGAFGLGFVAGPTLGGLLIGVQPGVADFSLPCLVAAGISLTAAGLVLVMLREPPRHQTREPRPAGFRQIWTAVKRNGIPGIISLNFLVSFAFTALMVLFPLWCQDRLGWSARQVSFAYVYIGLLVAFLQGVLVGPLTRQFGEPRVLLLGATALCTGLLLVPMVNCIVAFAIDTLLLCMGTSFCHPILTAMISQRTEASHQGTVMGAAGSVMAISRITSPPVAGFLFTQMGPNWPMLMGGFIMLPVVAAAAWMSLTFQRWRNS